MAKKPPDTKSGFYHIAIPLDGLDDPQLAEWEVMARPVSREEAAELTKLFQEIGRNQPCPCGSGRKSKRCCLRTVH